MKEIAISGTHGFIGKHLLEQLTSEGQVLDRSGVLPKGVDIVYDCAAFGNLSSQRKDNLEIYQANLMRVIKEFDHLEQGIKYIYISSSSVAREQQNAYSLSKMAAEQFLKLKAKDHAIIVVRPYSVTGPKDQQEHLIPTLIRSCLYGEEMPFVPWPVHDFVDISDVVNGVLTIAEKGKFMGEIYEIGSGVQYTNQEVKEIVEETTGKKANTTLVRGLYDYDTKDWKADISEMKNLGWKPIITLEQSIQRMVQAEIVKEEGYSK